MVALFWQHQTIFFIVSVRSAVISPDHNFLALVQEKSLLRVIGYIPKDQKEKYDQTFE